MIQGILPPLGWAPFVDTKPLQVIHLPVFTPARAVPVGTSSTRNLAEGLVGLVDPLVGAARVPVHEIENVWYLPSGTEAPRFP